MQPDILLEQVTPSVEPTQSPEQTIDIAPDKVRQQSALEGSARPIIPGFQNTGAGVAPVSSVNSLNFVNDSRGWGLASNGEGQFNGNRTVSTNFTPVLTLLAVTVYISDGTSPNGTLSGATGDICLKGDSGKIYYCVGGTTWVAPT